MNTILVSITAQFHPTPYPLTDVNSPVTQSQDDPTKFGFFEIFTSQEALDHHMNTTFQKEQAFFGKDPGVLVQPPTFEKFSLIEDIEKGIVV